MFIDYLDWRFIFTKNLDIKISNILLKVSLLIGSSDKALKFKNERVQIPHRVGKSSKCISLLIGSSDKASKFKKYVQHKSELSN